MYRNKISRLLSLAIAGTVLIILPFSSQQSASAVGPGDVNTGLLLWLDAADPDNDGNANNNPTNGSGVTTWTDKSGNGNDATILSGQGTPTYRTSSPINNTAAMRFTRTNDSSGQVFRVANVDIRAGTRPDVTVFAVYRAESATAGELMGIWGQDNGAWDRFAICCGYQNPNDANAATRGVIGLPPGGFGVDGAGNGNRLLTVVYDGNVNNGVNYGPLNGSSVWFEGGQITTFTDSTTASTADGPGSVGAKPDFRIGFDGDNSTFRGWIAEVIIYDRALSSTEIIAVSNYLGGKYDLTIAPTPVTQAATSVTSTTATLNGTVNAHYDTTTSITIRYSADSSTVLNNTATSPTVTPSQVGGNTDLSVSSAITGLNPSTTYFFRVTAQNSRGTNSGELLSFTTSEVVISSCDGAGSIQNGSFESMENASEFRTGGSYDINQNESSQIPSGWRTTAVATSGSNAKIETWRPGRESATATNMVGPSTSFAYQGSNLAEIAADTSGDSGSSKQGLYQDVPTINGSRIFWSYWHAFRGNSGADQVSVFRAAPTPNSIPASTSRAWTGSEQATPFGSGVSDLTTQYDTVTSTSSWQRSRGTFLANSTSTRFLFQNVQSPSGGVGNLIDDVRFTVYRACPITVRVVAGRQSNFTVRNIEQNSNNFQYYAPAGAIISAVFDVDATLNTLSVSNSANTSSTFTILSNTTGTKTASYRVSYTQDGATYTTSSTLTVIVGGEITASRPASVPLDPTLSSIQLPGIRFGTASRGFVCYDQVADASGTTLASPTVSLSRQSLISGITNVQTGTTVIDSGTVTNLSSQAALFKITSNVGKLGIGGSKFIRVRASSIDNTDGAPPSCANGISFVIELRRIKITQTRTFAVLPKNGRQN